MEIIVKQLVIQLARLGDIIQSKRLMLSLQNEGELCMLVDYSLIDLARILYPYAKIFGVHIHNKNASQVLENNIKVFGQLKQEKFDIVYPLNHSSFSQRIVTLFPKEIIRGYSRVGTHGRHSQWINLAFRWIKDRKYTPLNLMDFWAYLAPNPIPPHDVNPIAEGKGKGLGIVLSGQHPKRSLSPQDYAKIIHAIYERLHTNKKSISKNIYLFGTNNEKKFAERLLTCLPRKLHDRTINLAGQTNLKELIEYLQELDLVLTPDTGIAHLAAHLGVPVEGFYLSSANCFETGPYGIGHKIWQSSITCAPCMEFKDCPHTDPTNAKKESYSSLPCHKAFQTPAFLMRLDENKYTKETLEKQPLINIIQYTSSFEEYNYDVTQNIKTSFGLTWQGSQEDLHKQRRTEQRILLQAYCAATKPLAMDTPPIHNISLFHEEDWIFPQELP